MKVGLIPPIPNLEDWAYGDFHLLLTHLLDNPAYSSHYREQRRRGAYLVLDNSAHELSEGQDAEYLMLSALHLHAQEVVVPDVLFNAEETIQRCIETHEVWYEHDYPGMKNLNPSLMYVPQSGNPQEYKECLDELVGLHLYTSKHHNIRKDFVIGVSKDYEIWEGGIYRVLRDIITPVRNACAKKGINVQVHLLGWGRQLWALQEIADDFKWIRSTDSAKPFVYGRKGIILNPDFDPPEYPTRSHDYFKKKIRKGTRYWDAVEHNVSIFKTIAGAV